MILKWFGYSMITLWFFLYGFLTYEVAMNFIKNGPTVKNISLNLFNILAWSYWIKNSFFKIDELEGEKNK